MRTWLWQLAYAILGFAFLVSIFIAIMAWGTPGFWACIGVAAGSIGLLALLNRRLNDRREPK